MAVGFATLSGGDTVSFALDPSQLAAVQNALFNLSAHDGASEVSSVFGSTWQHPTDYNIYNLDGGTTVPFLPAHTDAIILDSVNGSAGTSLSGSSQHAALWVGNQGNDTFTINGPDQTIIAGDGNNAIHLAGGGEVSVGGGNNTISFTWSGPILPGDGSNRITAEASDSRFVDSDHDDDAAERGHRSGDSDHTDHGAGATTIIAGSGNNSLTLGSPTAWGEYDVRLGGGNDTVTLGLGQATISNSGGSTQLDATHSTGLTYTGAGTDTIYLGAGLASVTETGAATVIGGSRLEHGGVAPHATVQGGSGNFVFIGHNGDDSVTAGSGAAVLIAGDGNDTFHAGASTNALLDARGTDSDDAVALYGGSGNATLLGGSGRDSFYGGSGNTTMVGGSNWNFFTGGSGNDTMVAHTVPTGHGHDNDHDHDDEHAHGVDQNVFTFDAAVGGNHEIDGYNSTMPGGDTAIHLTFTNYGLTAKEIVADSSIVGNDTVITLHGAGGDPTTTITIKDFTGLTNWDINSH
jgi:Ca2+-binding RTX toxin-like protein